jgi:quinol monooxygenase YgiN
VSTFAVVRQIHPRPGREADAITWYLRSEPTRRQAGQTSQFVQRSLVDPTGYQLVQIWRDHAAYEAWRQTPERAGLAAERGRLMTQEPATMYAIP